MIYVYTMHMHVYMSEIMCVGIIYACRYIYMNTSMPKYIHVQHMYRPLRAYIS